VPRYVAHGLRLESNLPIAGLPRVPPGSGPADVAIRLGELPALAEGANAAIWHESTDLDGAGEPVLRIRRVAATGALWLRYGDGTQFLIDADARAVSAAWPAELTPEDTAVYLLGPVLGLLLRMRGRSCLHASVVAVGEQAIGFAGAAGAGKSTIAAAFARAGRPVLSDDLLVLNRGAEGFRAEPGYSRLRLWPESACGLYGSADALARLTPGWEKRYIDLAAEGSFCEQTLPLAAIYVLGDRLEGGGEAAVEPISARDALLSLVANAYTGHLPGAAERRIDFERFSRLRSAVPIRRLRPASDWSATARLPEIVLDDLAGAHLTRAG
jgi:hypothetical protein